MHLALNYKQKALYWICFDSRKNELWISNGKKLGVKKEINKSKNTLKFEINLEEMVLVTSKNHRNQTFKN